MEVWEGLDYLEKRKFIEKIHEAKDWDDLRWILIELIEALPLK